MVQRVMVCARCYETQSQQFSERLKNVGSTMLTDTIIAIVSTLFLPQVVASFSYYNMFTSKSKLHVFRVKLRNVAK